MHTRTRTSRLLGSYALPHGGMLNRAARLATYIAACFEVDRQRRHLATMDERAMNDLGLRPADISREISRSFWDIPGRLNPFR